MTSKPKAAAGAAKPKPLAGKPIERTNKQQDWWCPLCDHSQTKLVDHCAGCGATRDGDKVTAP